MRRATKRQENNPTCPNEGCGRKMAKDGEIVTSAGRQKRWTCWACKKAGRHWRLYLPAKNSPEPIAVCCMPKNIYHNSESTDHDIV